MNKAKVKETFKQSVFAALQTKMILEGGYPILKHYALNPDISGDCFTVKMNFRTYRNTVSMEVQEPVYIQKGGLDLIKTVEYYVNRYLTYDYYLFDDVIYLGLIQQRS